MNATHPGNDGVRRGAVRVLAVAAVLALAGCTTSEPDPQPDPEPTVAEPTETETETEPDPEPEDELPQVRVGETVQTVEGGPGEWEGLLVVEERGVVILESVAGTRGSRSELTLTDADGELLAEAEGARDPGEARFSDASQTDPLVIRTLDPGEYLVHVRGFDQEHRTDFEDGAELRAWVPDQVEVGSSTDFEFEDGFGGGWHGWVTIPEDGQYTFTAARQDDHSQPVLLVVDAREVLERNRDLPDLYDVHVDGVAQLDHEIPAGEYVIMVAEGLEIAGEATITIEGP